MIWLTWRQFRAQALTALVVLAAVVVYFMITGLRMHHTYAVDLASCTPQNDCGEVLNQFQGKYSAAFNLAELLVVAAPALIGIFWGAPLIGRELETGTHQLAWNQSVMRSRWLATKLTGVGLASIAAAGLLGYLLTWWAAPLDQINGSRFGAMTFATRDIVPIGYAAFAFTLGATAGLLLRRTLPAMAVTLAVFIGIQIFVPTTIRPHLLTSTTTNFLINQNTTIHGIYGSGGGSGDFYVSGLKVPQDAWVLSSEPVQDAHGRPVVLDAVQNCLPDPGPDGKLGGQPFEQFGACLASDHLHEVITYQPASHYWPLQWYETGIFFALAALLSGSCFWWIRRRRN
jgi:ABC-type transport system involved in multi-copper enzyme maturation permease subunit